MGNSVKRPPTANRSSLKPSAPTFQTTPGQTRCFLTKNNTSVLIITSLSSSSLSMAPSIPSPWLALSISLIISALSLSSAQSNLQTFFPPLSSPAFSNQPPPPPSPFSTANTTPPPSSNSNRKHIIEAVIATAATCFALSGLLFFILYRYTRDKGGGTAAPRPAAGRVNPDLALKGVIVDENGLDVLYWRNLAYSGSVEGPTKVCSHCSRPLPPGAKQKYDISTSHEYSESHDRDDSGIHERPLLPLNSINSSATLPDSRVSYQATSTSISSLTAKSTPAPPPAPPPPPPAKKPTPSPPPPPLPKKPSAPPPPPKPPLPGSKNAGGSSPPPPMPGGGAAKPPLAPVAVESARDPTKMKPLHWDKMNLPKVEHSMVWDKITNGSFRVDDDLMEALFGYVATNRKSPTSSSASTNPFVDPPRSPTQITILEPRKSQNIAIVVRTLAVSRNDILDALLDGRGLSPDTLEKLSRIAPSKDEQSQMLSFSGDPSRLSDGDSFLFHLLRAVPQPFGRIDAMLFRSTFEHEIRHVTESLHTLELACGELRTRGLFLKLLEAVLKAGNRMNAGTARGNAQAFNLTTLCKLSDVKSTDGKTTLLHFVVQEVVRSEGKRCMINRNQSLRRSISRSDSITSTSGGRSGARSGVDAAKREEREKEYMMLGLPVVGGLSTEFGNVKRAAAVDYDALVGACGSLGARVAEIRGFLVNCTSSSEGHDKFVKEMGTFLDAAAEQVVKMSGEQDRVLELVVKTREYYQTKDRGAQPLQLFVMVRDFLVMVDKACVDLTRNLQKKKPPPQAVAESPSGSERGRIIPARFPNLPPHFMSDGTRSPSDSDSEDGF